MAETEQVISTPQSLMITTAQTERQILVVGHQFMAPKFTALLQYLLDINDPQTEQPIDPGVSMIRYRIDKQPMREDGNMAMGTYEPNSGAIAINLMGLILKCQEVAKHPENKMAYRALLWHNLLLTVLHEVCHGSQYTARLAKGEATVFTKEDHDQAEAFAYGSIIELAKSVDIEIPDLDEWPFFAGHIIEFEKSFEQGETEWQVVQALLKSDKLVYQDEDQATDIFNMHELMFLLAGVEGSMDKAWMQERILPTLEESALDWTVRKAEEAKKADAEDAAVDAAISAEALEAKTAEAMEKLIDEFQQEQIKVLQVEVRNVLNMDETAAVTDDQLNLILAKHNKTLPQVMAEIRETILAGNEGKPTFIDDGLQVPPPPSDAVVPEVVEETPFDEYYPDSNDMPDASIPADQQEAIVGTGTVGGAASQTTAEIVAQAIPVTESTLTLTVAQIKDSCRQVWIRLFEHIMLKGQFNPQNPKGFDAPYAVLEPVSIVDIPHAVEIFKLMDSRNEAGHKISGMPIVGGMLKGDVLDKPNRKNGNMTMLPKYEFSINGGDGRLYKRTLLPQNPATESQTAILCRQGYQIAWLTDGNLPFGSPNRFLCKISRAPGQTITNYEWLRN